MAAVAAAAPERTVVVVEDDAHIADLLDMYLREAGFRHVSLSSRLAPVIKLLPRLLPHVMPPNDGGH